MDQTALKRTLDEMRARIEKDPRLPILTIYRQRHGKDSGRAPTLHPVETTTILLGAYLLAERIVMMVQWHEHEVAPDIIDEVSPFIIQCVRGRLRQWYKDVPDHQLEIQLWESSGTLFESDRPPEV